MLDKTEQDQGVSSRRGDDRRSARGDPLGRDHGCRGGAALSRPRARLQRRRQHAGDRRTARRLPQATGVVRAGARAQVPDADREGVDHPARSRQVQRPAARIRPHGGDRLQARRAAAVRHDRRHPECRPAQRASARSTSAASARSPAGASSTSIPRSGRCRPTRRRCASSSASSPTRWSAPPSWTRRSERIPIWKRCRCTAWCSRSRTRSTPRTCARPAAATRATTSTFRRAIMCWSSSFATRARSSSPRR